ncbi:MAG: sensor histidine kinase [Candidatus Krumholzibacteriia bacterium]
MNGPERRPDRLDRPSEVDLQHAHAVVEALRGEEVDAVVGRDHLLMLRLRETEEKLRRTEAELRELTNELEQRVADRTAELERRTREVQELALEVSRAEDQERRRLAQYLHDHLQQLLVSVQMQLQMLARRADAAPIRERLGKLQRTMEDAIASSRTLTFELSPPVLDEAGLPPTLEWLGNWVHENYGLAVAVRLDQTANPVDRGHRSFVFGAARELLFNVAKHAGVDHAELILARTGSDHLQIVVIDGGGGFDPADSTGASGFGLARLSERVRLMGGSMEIESAPGRGTRVSLGLYCELPSPADLSEEPQASESAG